MLQSNADRCDEIWDNVCLAEDGDELCSWIFNFDDGSFDDYDDDEDEDWYNSEDEELDSFEEEEEWRARSLRG